MCIQRAASIAAAGGLVVVPVAQHHAVAARAQLAALADPHHLAGLRDHDLDLHVRVHLADRGDLLGQRRADARLRADRAGLGHAVGEATSRMCIRACTCFMTSTGQGEPAMMPVRSVERSYFAKSGWFSSAMNMVGTP